MNIKLIAVGSRPWELWLGHWGLSYLIDDTILYDTFSNYRVLYKKLQKAEVDTSKIKTVVISHDHWDHTGGLCEFLKEHPGTGVFLPMSASDETKQRITEAGGKLIDSDDPKILKENVQISGEIAGRFNKNQISEQFISIKTKNGLFLIVGCSHPGIVNMVRQAKSIFDAPVYGIIGGLHLMDANSIDIHACANALKNEGIKMISPTHCTGWRAERIFKKVFGNGFVHMREGQTLTL